MREGWEKRNLGEVCEILDSKRKPITKRDRIPGNIPYYGATGVLSHVKDYLFDEQLVLLGEDGAKWKSGDNSAFIIRGKSWVNNHAHVLRPQRKILDDNWLVYNLNFQNLMPYISGMTVPKLNQGNMKKIQIPIPPLAEQKQIVALLDQAFAAIDRAKANIERNMENARELFQSKLNEIFSQRGEGWEERSLGDIGIVQTGTTPSTKDKSNYGDYIGFAKPSHFNEDGSIDTGESMLSKSGLDKGRLFDANSTLMVCIGATIGKTGFSARPISSNQQINALTPNENYVPKILYFALISPFVQSQIMRVGKASQATLPIINKSKWKKIKVNLPKNKLDQSQIIDLLEKMKSQCIELENDYLRKIKGLEELKKSLLQRAFTGELTKAV
jgi:type I restriction enzyme S subunit